MQQNKQTPLLVAVCLSYAALSPTAAQADLLGLTADLPNINFGATGVINYDATTGTVTVSADPSNLFSLFPPINAYFIGTSAEDIKDITITFQVDSNGNVVPNDAQTPDLVVRGAIDFNGDGIKEGDGILLQAEVSQFGFLNGASGGGDSFDIRLNQISGALDYLYAGQDLAITIESAANTEYPIPFDGSFSANWQNQASGQIGSTAPIPASAGGCHLKLVAKCSIDGGPYQDKCRIKVTRSSNHWESREYNYNGQTFQISKYGTHGYDVPAWAANFPTTAVTFKYDVTNDGDNPVSNVQIEDSFDTPISVDSTTLAVGSSLSVTRTVELSEGIENDVTALGSYGSEMCAATDIVVVRDKLREHTKHDDDDFKNKAQ